MNYIFWLENFLIQIIKWNRTIQQIKTILKILVNSFKQIQTFQIMDIKDIKTEINLMVIWILEIQIGSKQYSEPDITYKKVVKEICLIKSKPLLNA